MKWFKPAPKKWKVKIDRKTQVVIEVEQKSYDYESTLYEYTFYWGGTAFDMPEAIRKALSDLSAIESACHHGKEAPPP